MSVKKFTGQVVSNKMQDTVVVAVELPRRHPIYGKMLKNTKRLKAHATQLYPVGTVVSIVETKPFAKQVSFAVLASVQTKESK
jgi:small subunit ribosomal protein S17